MAYSGVALIDSAVVIYILKYLQTLRSFIECTARRFIIRASSVLHINLESRNIVFHQSWRPPISMSITESVLVESATDVVQLRV